MKPLRVFLLLMTVILSSTGCSLNRDYDESYDGNYIEEFNNEAVIPDVMSAEVPENVTYGKVENMEENNTESIGMTKISRAAENGKLADIIGRDDFKKLQEAILIYLGHDFKDIIKDKGLQNDVIESDGLKVLRYNELGMDFGYDPYSSEILVVMPIEDKEVFGIKRGDSVSEVQEILGEKDYIIDYANGYGRLAVEYRAGDYDLRVIYDLGKVSDINIVFGGVPTEASMDGVDTIYDSNGNVIIENEDLVFTDQMTGEEITIFNMLDNLNMSGEDMIYRYGYYDGSLAGETLFKDRFSYIYSDLGVIFVGEMNQSDVNLLVFYNRIAFGIERGMAKDEVLSVLGEPIKEDMEKFEGGKNLYRLVYSREVKGREFEFSVYLDDKEGKVYFSTFRLWDI